MHVLAKDFVLSPPVAGVKDDDIRIPPLVHAPAHMVHSERARHIGRSTPRRPSLGHQKRISVILHSAVEVLKPVNSDPPALRVQHQSS